MGVFIIPPPIPIGADKNPEEKPKIILKIEIFITLGPSTLNKIFLKKIKKSVNLLRLNLSHVELKK